jgi:hypothetical protein
MCYKSLSIKIELCVFVKDTVSRKEMAPLFLPMVFHSFTKYMKGKGTVIPIQAW